MTVEIDTAGTTGEPTLRDRLAMDRTILANERTLLAYVRTAIMLAATGATLLSLYGASLIPIVSGWALITAAVGVAMLGTTRFRALARSLK